MSIKEWAKENKKKLAIAGVTIGGIAFFAYGIKKGRDSDLELPNWKPWDVVSHWMDGSLEMLTVDDVPISALGEFGEKMVSELGAPADAIVSIMTGFEK